MTKLAKLASPLNWRHQANGRLPRFFLLTDVNRLPDPSPVLTHLPRAAAAILPHPDPTYLSRLAHLRLPRAHRLGPMLLVRGGGARGVGGGQLSRVFGGMGGVHLVGLFVALERAARTHRVAERAIES